MSLSISNIPQNLEGHFDASYGLQSYSSKNPGSLYLNFVCKSKVETQSKYGHYSFRYSIKNTEEHSQRQK